MQKSVILIEEPLYFAFLPVIECKKSVILSEAKNPCISLLSPSSQPHRNEGDKSPHPSPFHHHPTGTFSRSQGCSTFTDAIPAAVAA